MRVEVVLDSRTAVAALTLVCLMGLVGLGLLGAWATPAEGGRPLLLTPERWAILRLARQARAETAQLQADLVALRRVLATPHPDPVEAMMLAQDVYARHREGTPATAPARQALIQAAAQAARYASGVGEYSQVLEALARCEAMLARLEASEYGPGSDLGLSDHVAAAP